MAMTLEIPQKSWNQFFFKLNSQRDALMDVRVEAGGDMRLVARDTPLQSVMYDVGDACNSALTVEFGSPNGDLLQHRIIEPIRVILRKESNGDHYNLLEIPAESGLTVIIFRPGISPVFLQELELPQLSASTPTEPPSETAQVEQPG